MRGINIVREEIQRLVLGSAVPIEVRRELTRVAARLVKRGLVSEARQRVSRALRRATHAPSA